MGGGPYAATAPPPPSPPLPAVPPVAAPPLPLLPPVEAPPLPPVPSVSVSPPHAPSDSPTPTTSAAVTPNRLRLVRQNGQLLSATFT
jgi:hypothetical protein